MTINDFELVDAWSKGDRQAGDLLVRRHYLTLVRFFFETVNPRQCRTLTCITFRCLHSSSEHLDRASEFNLVLVDIARDLLISRLDDRSSWRSANMFLQTVVDSRHDADNDLRSEFDPLLDLHAEET